MIHVYGELQERRCIDLLQFQGDHCVPEVNRSNSSTARASTASSPVNLQITLGIFNFGFSPPFERTHVKTAISSCRKRKTVVCSACRPSLLSPQDYYHHHHCHHHLSPCYALPACASFLMWLFRVFSSAVFLAVTVSSIPLAFDVGGKTCGLAFSLSLATFYFLFSLLRLVTPEQSWFRSSLVVLIRSTQWILIPILLIWSLNRFSVDAESSGGWVERTFSGKRAQDSSVQEWLFGRDGLVEAVALGNWDRLLRWSTPVFQLAEGFCSLLVIQAAGQITRWLVNRGGRSDSWMVRLTLSIAMCNLETDIENRSVFWSSRRQSSPVPSISFGASSSFLRSPTWMPPSSVSPLRVPSFCVLGASAADVGTR